MNGHPAISELPPRSANPEAVKTLEELLKRARSGEVISVAVVYSFGPNHAQITTNTLLPMELHFGADLLKATLFNLMTKPPAASQLLRPFRGG